MPKDQIGRGSLGDKRARAAEYVRMSTDHQRYSTQNQADMIRQYAERHGMDIVRTYADEGKSGLNIGGREAIQRLIDDVNSGRADFEVILVYDVSRWGRFQDTDEGAYYEYICKRAGIAVRYCAEQFENDGSPISDIFKSIKRGMAGEFSRELSTKVFAGQRRLIELGYRQGGPAGFGLRRRLIDQSGMTKAPLSRGEHKSIQTDRVILIPGPPEEVDTVRWIYRTFVESGKTESEIASALNAQGSRTDIGRPWTRGTVHQILINEKYIGHNVWNRQSFKLKKRRVKNERELWIRANNVFEALVDPMLYDAAQVIIRDRSVRLSDNEMLEKLRHLYESKGYLSGLMIDEMDRAPSSTAYARRFGSLARAYQLVGFTPERDYRYIDINRSLRRFHDTVVANTIAGIERAGGHVQRHPTTDKLTINFEFTASLVIARCQQTPAGSLRWHIRFDAGMEPDISIVVRMDTENQTPLDYYLFPTADITAPRLRLAEFNGLSLDCYRFDSLEPLFSLAERVILTEVA